jgi:hypothetical protein
MSAFSFLSVGKSKENQFLPNPNPIELDREFFPPPHGNPPHICLLPRNRRSTRPRWRIQSRDAHEITSKPIRPGRASRRPNQWPGHAVCRSGGRTVAARSSRWQWRLEARWRAMGCRNRGNRKILPSDSIAESIKLMAWRGTCGTAVGRQWRLKVLALVGSHVLLLLVQITYLTKSIP